MSTVEVPRPPRTVPRLPGGELTVEPPPEPERPVPPALLARLLPAVMLLGSVGFVALGPRDPSSLMFGGMFALSTVGMLLVGGGGRGAGQRQAAVDEERRDYLRYLAATRRRVRVVATEQRARWSTATPIPRPGRRCSRPAGCGSAGVRIPTSASCARVPALSAWRRR